MLAITYKPMKIKENKGSQMGHTGGIFKKRYEMNDLEIIIKIKPK